jgi:hypothetical protein
MDRVKWIEHKGKKILYIDYSNLQSSVPAQKAEALELMKQVRKVFEGLNEKTLFMSDVTDAVPDKDTLNGLKELAGFANGKQIVARECVVGMSSMQKVLMNVINFVSKAKLTMFDSIEEAKEWLVQ